MRMGMVHELWGANVRLPATDACTIDGKRKKQIGVADGVVIEEVACSGLKIVERGSPSTIRDNKTYVVLLVTLAVKRQEAEVLRLCEGKNRPGHRIQRRSLVVARVRSAQHPSQPRHGDRRPCTRIPRMLAEASIEVGEAHTPVQRPPRRDLPLLIHKC